MTTITRIHDSLARRHWDRVLGVLTGVAILGWVPFARAGEQPPPCDVDPCASGCPLAQSPCCDPGYDGGCEEDDPYNDEIGPGEDDWWPIPWPGDDIVYLPPCPPYGPFGGGPNPFVPPDSAGDALHVQFTTGNVWTRVPIIENTSEASASGFVIRYDSQRAAINGPLGYGWSHAYDSFIVDADPNQVVLHAGDGTRTAFTVSGPLFIPPPGSDLKLTTVGGLYRVTTSYGAVLSFNSNKRLSEITERSGLTSRINYDAQGRVDEIINPFGRKIDITYDGNGKVYQVAGPDSATTTFGYTNGDLTSITDPQSHATQYQYDGSHRLTRETLRNGVAYTAEYSPYNGYDARTLEVVDGASSHLVARVWCTVGFPATRSSTITYGFPVHTDGRGNAWQIRRDHLGRVWRIISPNGKNQYTTWGGPNDGNGRNRIVESTDERGETRSFTYDAYGNVASVTDEEGYETLYEHENTSFRSLVTARTDPGGNVWEYQYDGVGRLTTVVDPITDDGPGLLDAQITYSYESFFGDMEDIGTLGLALPGRVKILHKTDRNGKTTRFEYNGRGDLVKVTRDYGVGQDNLNLVSEYEFDDAGRMTARVVHRGPSDTTRTEYDYDTRGWLETVEADPTGLDLTTSFTYDYHGNVDTVTNPRGYVTKYEYDYRNRLTAQTEAYGEANFGLQTEFEYDGNNNLTAVSDPRHTAQEPYQTTFAYNTQNFLTSITDAEGYLTEFAVDEVGNVTRRDRHLTTTPGSKYSVSMQYDGLNRVKVVVDDPDDLALATQLFYEAPGGCGCGATPNADKPYKIIDPAGEITYSKYDALDRLTQVIRKVGDTSIDPDGDDVVAASEYDAHGNVTAFVGPEGERTEYEYDGAHRRTKTRVIDPSVAAQHLVTEFGYDGADNVIQIDFPNGNTGTLVYDKVNRLTEGWDDLGTNGVMQYDDNGNVTWMENGEGERWSFEYDPVDRLKKLYDPIIETPTDKFTEYQYDKLGLRTRMINAKGIVTKYTYDKINRMVTLTEDFGGTNQASTSWDYNGPGWVNWMKDNEQNQTSYVYDGAGRVTQVVYPDLGDVDFTYYPAGGVYTRTDQKQVVTTYTRDDLHRMTARGYSTGGSDSFAYDKSGRLTQASNSLVQVGLDYDGMGRLDSETHTFAGTATPYVVDFAYNMGPAAWTQTTTYPGGRSVTRSYDERFRIDGVDGGTNVGADWSYDLADRRTGAALGNGIASLFEYDDNGRMTHLKHAVSGNPIYELGYGYDAVGNRVYKEDLVNSTRSEFYEYDNRDRLRRFKRGTLAPTKDSITEVAHATLPSRHDWSDSTFMDSRGNWLQCTRILNGQETREARTVNGVNEYTSIDPDALASPPDPVVPGYDDNGNLTADPTAPNAGGQAAGQTYTYDAENRLTQVTRTSDSQVLLEIRYDGIGRRVESVEHIDPSDGQAYSVAQVTRHIHAGLTPVVDYNVSSDGVGGHLNTRLREFIWGDRFPEPVALIDWTAAGDVGAGTAEVLHYIHDALGSVVGLTNAAGALVERYTYDPYGQTYIEDPATQTFRGWSRFGNPWSWTGQRFDATTGLYHFLFRSYSPRLGRWLQRDPAEYVDGVNLFSYARTDPVGRTDPSGLWGTRVHEGIIDGLSLPSSIKDALKRGSANADSLTNPTPESHHAMRKPGQSKEEAQNEARQWINETLYDVSLNYRVNGRLTTEDWEKIGEILHFVMDETCPLHGWQVWPTGNDRKSIRERWKHYLTEGQWDVEFDPSNPYWNYVVRINVELINSWLTTISIWTGIPVWTFHEPIMNAEAPGVGDNGGTPADSVPPASSPSIGDDPAPECAETSPGLSVQ